MLDIVAALDRRMESRRRNYPCHVNRASEIGHACTRYLTYCRTAWEKATLPDVGLQYIFQEGKLQERVVIADLNDCGFHVLGQQRDYFDDEHKLSGHGDCKIALPTDGPPGTEAAVYPAEIKSMSPYTWQTVDGWESLRDSRYVHMRKYPHQLNTYLWFAQAASGFFLFKNKTTGRIKQVWLPYQADMMAADLEKCGVVNEHVAAGTVPDRIEDRDWCSSCRFNHLCLPDVINEGARFLDDAELLEKLERRDALVPLKKEYEALHKEVTVELKGCEEAIIGDFSISGKWIDKKAFAVAASRYWRTDIVKMGETKEETVG